jgi:hypothetical protein
VLRKAATDLVFVQLRFGNATYISDTKRLVVCTHVDSFIITGPGDVAGCKKDLAEHSNLEDLGRAQHIQGVRLRRITSKRTMTPLQDGLIGRIPGAGVPIAPSAMSCAVPNICTAARDLATDYQFETGTRMYLMTLTRPDLVFTPSVSSRYSHNPSAEPHRPRSTRSAVSTRLGECWRRPCW